MKFSSELFVTRRHAPYRPLFSFSRVRRAPVGLLHTLRRFTLRRVRSDYRFGKVWK